jgi:DeoR/GlpR family transcriptional regulator of sugar metabolism
MLAAERRNSIEKLITEKGSVLVVDLAKQFNVTTETIRGDLYKLEKQGVLFRTYGGAMIAGNSEADSAINERDTVNFEGKQRIGLEAAQMIRGGETIFLDASTSSLHVARSIKNKRGITVITNAEKVVTELSSCADLHVICTGGVLNARNMSFSGRIAENNIRENYFADKIFFSCKGVTIEHGLVDVNETEAEIKKAMIKNSKNVIFLCDHNKIGKLGVSRVASFSDIDCMITDIKLDEEWIREAQNRDIHLISV